MKAPRLKRSTVAASNDPHGMNDARNITEQSQEDVDPECSAQANREQHADRRQQDRQENAKEIAHGLIGAIGKTQPGNGVMPTRFLDKGGSPHLSIGRSGARIYGRWRSRSASLTSCPAACALR